VHPAGQVGTRFKSCWSFSLDRPGHGENMGIRVAVADLDDEFRITLQEDFSFRVGGRGKVIGAQIDDNRIRHPALKLPFRAALIRCGEIVVGEHGAR
jgi:hypothetical protein